MSFYRGDQSRIIRQPTGADAVFSIDNFEEISWWGTDLVTSPGGASLGDYKRGAPVPWNDTFFEAVSGTNTTEGTPFLAALLWNEAESGSPLGPDGMTEIIETNLIRIAPLSKVFVETSDLFGNMNCAGAVYFLNEEIKPEDKLITDVTSFSRTLASPYSLFATAVGDFWDSVPTGDPGNPTFISAPNEIDSGRLNMLYETSSSPIYGVLITFWKTSENASATFDKQSAQISASGDYFGAGITAY